ncbi:MAG TPA: type II secretion system F family protein [Candidatus Dormibacteraeota bacterium]|nr:type II secretion system F family protein [Candidatus Dormibacteraeota bacterium]
MAVLYIATLLGLVAAVGVFATFWSLQPAPPSNADVVEGRLRVYERGLPVSIAEDELQVPFRERVIRPILKRIGQFIEQSIPAKARQQLHLKIQLAGRPAGMGTADFIAFRYVLTALLCTLGILLGLLNGSPVALAILAAKGAAWGLFGPMLWLNRRVKRRKTEMQNDLPDVIDVLVVCVEAGLTFEAAMEKVAEKFDHALAEEFGRVIQEIRLGRPRLEALNDMGQRLGVEELNNFVQAIIQSEQLGSGVSRILRAQSDEIRIKHLLTAQEKGARASLKMLIPMLGCIFPTLWVIILGPAALLALKYLAGG